MEINEIGKYIIFNWELDYCISSQGFLIEIPFTRFLELMKLKDELVEELLK